MPLLLDLPIYPTKRLLIQNRILSRHGLPALWGHSTTVRGRLPVFRLRCACQQGKCIDEICD
jgi:hypothetical protein